MQYLDPYTQHPSRVNMQKVIDRFATVLPSARKRRNSLNMYESGVNCKDAISCGTPHCAGGWYYVACRNRSALRAITKNFGRNDFYSGAQLVAHDLGFKSSIDLETWARRNPKIWGNVYGADMFGAHKAWGDAKSLAGLVKHLRGVARRLPK